MTIYLDIIFIENIIMNYSILYSTAILIREKPNNLRLILSSALGAIYAIIAYLSILKIYSSIILKILLSMIMIYIAFNSQGIRKMLKQLLFFYLTSFVFGGAAFFLIYIVKPQDIIIKNGMLVGTYPIKIAFLGVILGFTIIVLAFKTIKLKYSRKSLLCNIEISLNQKIIETTAMIDTGNLLKDPISSIPVIVVEHSLLYDILPKHILNNLEEILGGDLKDIPDNIKEKYISKLKVIPFSSLGKQHGMLLGIKADSITIKSEDETINREEIIVGIYDKSLTKQGEYRALIGINLL